MEFLKIDPRMDDHPDILEAGFVGATVFQAILRAVGMFDRQGVLPVKFSTTWLARRMNLQREDVGMEPEAFVMAGIDRCLKVGLLERTEDGVQVPGWERFYSPPMTGAERAKKWRDTHVTSRRSRNDTVTEPVTRNTTPQDSTPPTPLHSTKEETPAAQLPPAFDLEQRLADTFQRKRGRPYRWGRGDHEALRQLLGEGNTPEEIDRRWGLGLERTRYPSISAVADLGKHWNACATDEPKPIGKQPLRANVSDEQFREATAHLKTDEHGDLVLE